MLFINTEVFSQISCETNQDIPNFLSNHSSHPHQTSQNNTEPLMNGQYCFNVYFHFVRKSDGTGGQPSNTIHQMIKYYIFTTDHATQKYCNYLFLIVYLAITFVAPQKETPTKLMYFSITTRSERNLLTR